MFDVYKPILFPILFILAVCEDCQPEDMKGKVEYCWTNRVDFVDRFSYASKSALNFAKRKLGVGVEEEIAPPTCEYYKCVFGQLRALNGNGFPVKQKLQDYLDGHVTVRQARDLSEQVDKCFGALSESIVQETYFDGDIGLEDPPAEGLASADESGKEQNSCDKCKELMKCLSYHKGCHVFVFP